MLLLSIRLIIVFLVYIPLFTELRTIMDYYQMVRLESMKSPFFIFFNT